jgi:hypothetical protein
MTALAILFACVFTALVSTALGALLLRDTSRDPALCFVCGAALLSLVVFCMCAVGMAYSGVFAGAGAIVLAAGWRGFAGLERKPGPIPQALLIAFAIFSVLYLFNAMAPEISYDGSRYHLGLVARYLREHGFHPITDNMYASLPQSVEMLFLFAFAFGRHSAAAMVHFLFLLALPWMMWRYARHAGFPIAGACAALLVYASPMVGVDGISAYNDVAGAAIAFALFWALQLWDGARSDRLLAAIGLLAGFAFAAKYTAWPAIPYAMAVVAWKSRRFRDVAIVALCAAVMITPWMAKNWVWVQNPLAPFFNSAFPNPYVTADFEREYRHHMAWYDLQSRWQIPMQVTVHGSLGGLLGPVFLLAPIGLLALRRPEGRQLLLAALVFGANYFTNIGTRFLIPPLPFVALALMLVLAEIPKLAIGVALVNAALSWPSVVRLYCAPDAWHLVKVPFREALRIKPEEGFLESNLPYYGTDRLIETATPPGSVIFCFTPIPEAYSSRTILVAYQSAANIERRELLWKALGTDSRRTAAVQVGRSGVDYLLVIDSDFGAEDLRANTAAWGLTLAGEYKDARLYRLPH